MFVYDGTILSSSQPPPQSAQGPSQSPHPVPNPTPWKWNWLEALGRPRVSVGEGRVCVHVVEVNVRPHPLQHPVTDLPIIPPASGWLELQGVPWHVICVGSIAELPLHPSSAVFSAVKH